MGSFGLGILGIVLLQAIASAAVAAYFVRHRAESVWREIVAPTLGAVGLSAGLVLMVDHYATLTASSVGWINDLPWLLPIAALLGVAVTSVRPARATALAAEPAEAR